MKNRFTKIIISLIALVFVLFTMIIQAFAWYGPGYHPNGDAGDVHYRDTKYWAIEAGMGKLWATQVGDSDAAVDVLYKTELRWHLDRSGYTGECEDTRLLQSKNEMILAKRKIDEAASFKKKIDIARSRWDKLTLTIKMIKAKEEAVLYLGRSLHPVQDLYAHMNAGVGKTDSEIGISHGELNTDPVDVAVVYQDGTTENRKIKLEEKDSNGFLYSLYDDVYYDYDNGWIFLAGVTKEQSKRWQNTKTASMDLIKDFMNYASEMGITF